ncbi:MAG: NAD(P)/FAD-dependent oxidoreductase [Hyphomicrobiales bacterium]
MMIIPKRKNVAVIGSGIAGLSAGWLLSKTADVTLYEADDRLGGHANTVDIITPEGQCPVDTGFIVYNEATYPNLTNMFDHLGVETQSSTMTFAASFDDGAYEYSGTRASGLFAQKANILNTEHWRMIMDIARFFREGPGLTRDRDENYTLRALLKDGGFSQSFIKRHILPMGACIWSNSLSDVLDMSARAFVNFFENHGLLKITNRPQWRTVAGGSRAYIEKLTADWDAKVRLGTPVTAVRRSKSGVEVSTRHGDTAHFDDVVFACHSDQALALLADPTPRECALVGAIRYSPNKAVLHTDKNLMPKRQAAWASWNYLETSQTEQGSGVSLTYWMNALQNLPTKMDVFVSLNPARAVRDEHILQEFNYAHPVLNAHALRAQKELWALQGQNNTWFCGAWFGSGFHEDGLQAGLAVAEDLGGWQRPWKVENPSSRIHVTTRPLATFQEAAE